MKRLLLAVLVSCCLAIPLRAQSPYRWTATNTLLASTSSLAILGDYLSTLTICRHREARWIEGRLWGYHEVDPLLPKHPTILVETLAATTGFTLNLFVAHKLPNPWRNLFLGTITGIESYMVLNNMRNAAEMSLPLFSFPF